MSLSKLLRILLLTAAGLLGSMALCLLGAYLYVSARLPKVETLADYRPPVITRILGDDGALIAELYRERRILVPVSSMPRQLIEAFVAAEDSKFFHHKGVDLGSIARAALKNIRAGGIVQGGSTITQQVAKSLLLTPERKFSRKFKEAILAWRMEQHLTKEEILYLYLNQIYLGHGAYGVQAAAENYFAKNVEDLSLAECAILAGLPQAPSRYSPYRHLQRAKDRQRYVLERMAQEGYIPAETAAQAQDEELIIHPRSQPQVPGAAYFTEQVRRYLEQTFGSEQTLTGGLEVHTTMNLAMQQAAQKAVRNNLRNHDRRQGYRGPLRALGKQEQELFLTEQTATWPEAPPVGERLEGVLIKGTKQELVVRIGSFTGLIPRKVTAWAGNLQVLAQGQPVKVDSAKKRVQFPVGSVLLVEVIRSLKDGKLGLTLAQEPKAQAALVALDPRSGEVKAMVGGYDFTQSQFNRAIQAKRLPGSAFKPLIYAAALDKGYTPATIVLDTPLIYREKGEQGQEKEWKPKNYRGSFSGPTSLRRALARSYNIVTIKILQDIGIHYAIGYARKLGIESPLAADLTLALGSSAISPLELATAYSVFANGGVRCTPNYISRVVDRNGRVLKSVDPADFPDGVEDQQQLIRNPSERVISADTAYLVTNLMESVVQNGTGFRAKALGRSTAAKTGTTNDQKDAWFAGYVPQLMAVSWTGYDQERSLGKKETGSRAAAPAWVEFMKEALKDLPRQDFPVPDGIEFRPIDPDTGLLAPEDGSEVIFEAFASGTAPTHYALESKQPNAQDFFKMDLEDL
ncbi:MAG: penicillin-binding protein [Desulfuromonadales bacterium C00003096]|jgi:penicillin-binding protein 1A|nr:MAG: penicillin-binding protein [Desulfuromonadales bacterium C00003096]